MILFKVGNKEQHEVLFNYDNIWFGKVKILVDNKEKSSSRVLFIGRTPFSFQVGNQEKHLVTIELNNPLFAAFRGSNVKVFIDEKLIRQDHISGNFALFIFFLFIIPLLLVIILLLK